MGLQNFSFFLWTTYMYEPWVQMVKGWFHQIYFLFYALINRCFDDCYFWRYWKLYYGLQILVPTNLLNCAPCAPSLKRALLIIDTRRCALSVINKHLRALTLINRRLTRLCLVLCCYNWNGKVCFCVRSG